MRCINIEMLHADIKNLAKRYGLFCDIETDAVPVDISKAIDNRKQDYNVSVCFYDSCDSE